MEILVIKVTLAMPEVKDNRALRVLEAERVHVGQRDMMAILVLKERRETVV
jgi:hypothetical protein